MQHRAHAHRPQVVLFSAAFLAAFAVASVSHAASVIIDEGIVYGQGGGVDLRLDLARPGDGTGPFPAIVFIHGGGWQDGDRSVFRGRIREAAQRGYVAVTVEYRLTDPDGRGRAANPFPAQIEDVKCAVRWLRANAETYNINPDKIGATGTSAGGHLSLLLGTSAGTEALEGNGGNSLRSSKVQAVVNQFGPTNLERLRETSPIAAPVVETLIGTPDVRELGYKLASPTSYASADDPPILTQHGTEDKIVPPEQALLFNSAMLAAGGKHTLNLLDGQHHGFQGAAREQAEEEMYQFFDTHLRDGARAPNPRPNRPTLRPRRR